MKFIDVVIWMMKTYTINMGKRIYGNGSWLWSKADSIECNVNFEMTECAGRKRALGIFCCVVLYILLFSCDTSSCSKKKKKT